MNFLMHKAATLLAILICFHAPGGYANDAARGNDSDQLNETDAVIKGGLKWIASRQGPDGGWWSTTSEMYPDNDNNFPISEAGRNLFRAKIAYFEAVKRTASALRVFMAAGNTPLEGEYAGVVAAGQRFLFQTIGLNGLLCGGPISVHEDYGGGHSAVEMGYPLIEQVDVTYVLCELRGQLQIPGEREILQRLVNVIEGEQNTNGGWSRFLSQRINSWAAKHPSLSPDLLATCLTVRALRSAQEAGLRVNPQCFEKAAEYARNNHGSKFQDKFNNEIIYLCSDSDTKYAIASPLAPFVDGLIRTEDGMCFWKKTDSHFGIDMSFLHTNRTLSPMIGLYHYLVWDNLNNW